MQQQLKVSNAIRLETGAKQTRQARANGAFGNYEKDDLKLDTVKPVCPLQILIPSLILRQLWAA